MIRYSACSDLACLSSFCGGDLPCHLSSLMDLRRVTDFQFVHLFCCCENRSDNFQALYMSDGKPEVPVYCICMEEILCDGMFISSQFHDQ